LTEEKRSWVSDSVRYAQTEDAAFLGWQKIPIGGALALYCVTASAHPSHRSTVSGKTLHNLNLQIPQIPFAAKQVSKKV